MLVSLDFQFVLKQPLPVYSENSDNFLNKYNVSISSNISLILFSKIKTYRFKLISTVCILQDKHFDRWNNF